MATLPEGFSSWDEYDAYRKATGPSMRSAYPNKFTEFIATNPLTNFLVPGAEKFLQRGGTPSAFDIGLGALDVATGPIPAGAMLGSVVKKLARRPNKYVGLSDEQKVPLVLKEFPQIVGEGWKNARQIVARGVQLRKEAPRKGAGLRPGKAAHQRSRRAELAAKMRAVGSKNLTPKEQMQMAAWRARSVIRNIKRRDVRPSGRSAYKLSKAEEKRLYNELYDQKLKEIKAGITWGDRQTVSHHFPQKAISEYGGDPFGSGLTTMANITDAAGNFAFLPQRINSSLGNIIPRSLLNLK